MKEFSRQQIADALLSRLQRKFPRDKSLNPPDEDLELLRQYYLQLVSRIARLLQEKGVVDPVFKDPYLYSKDEVELILKHVLLASFHNNRGFISLYELTMDDMKGVVESLLQIRVAH